MNYGNIGTKCIVKPWQSIVFALLFVASILGGLYLLTPQSI